MKRTLYVTDLDGTLLNSDSLISPISAGIISDLTARGALITVATARTPATVEPLLRDTRIDLPAIVMTGATLWEPQTRRFDNPRFIDPATVSRLLCLCREAHTEPMVYSLATDGVVDVYAIPTDEPMRRAFIDQRSHLPLKRIHPCEPTDEAISRCALVFCVGPRESTDRAGALVGSHTDCAYCAYGDIFNPAMGYLEIFAPGVSKAAAIREVADRVGADSITVFGDNLNDLPMMAAADRAIAVANALPQVRQAARLTIGPNTADSVARFIAADFYAL